jgi:hypothetical protein
MGTGLNMEREAMEESGRHDADRSRVRSADDELGADDEEFASLEDVGPEPAENPAVDDV